MLVVLIQKMMKLKETIVLLFLDQDRITEVVELVLVIITMEIMVTTTIIITILQ